MIELIKLKSFLLQLGIDDRDIKIQEQDNNYIFRYGYWNRLDKFREAKIEEILGAEMDQDEDYGDGFMKYCYYIPKPLK